MDGTTELSPQDKLKFSITNASPELDVLMDEEEKFEKGLSYDWDTIDSEIDAAKGCLCIERCEEMHEVWTSSPRKPEKSVQGQRTNDFCADIWRVRANELREVEKQGVRLKKRGKLENPIESRQARLSRAEAFIKSLEVRPEAWCLNGSSLKGGFNPDSDIDILALFSRKDLCDKQDMRLEECRDIDTELIDGCIDFHSFYRDSPVFQTDPKLLRQLERTIEANKKEQESIRST